MDLNAVQDVNSDASQVTSLGEYRIIELKPEKYIPLEFSVVPNEEKNYIHLVKVEQDSDGDVRPQCVMSEGVIADVTEVNIVPITFSTVKSEAPDEYWSYGTVEEMKQQTRQDGEGNLYFSSGQQVAGHEGYAISEQVANQEAYLVAEQISGHELFALNTPQQQVSLGQSAQHNTLKGEKETNASSNTAKCNAVRTVKKRQRSKVLKCDGCDDDKGYYVKCDECDGVGYVEHVAQDQT